MLLVHHPPVVAAAAFVVSVSSMDFVLRMNYLVIVRIIVPGAETLYRHQQRERNNHGSGAVFFYFFFCWCCCCLTGGWADGSRCKSTRCFVVPAAAAPHVATALQGDEMMMMIVTVDASS
jgi:hypothetical protein